MNDAARSALNHGPRPLTVLAGDMDVMSKNIACCTEGAKVSVVVIFPPAVLESVHVRV
jgi:hypothetical protein